MVRVVMGDHAVVDADALFLQIREDHILSAAGNAGIDQQVFTVGQPQQHAVAVVYIQVNDLQIVFLPGLFHSQRIGDGLLFRKMDHQAVLSLTQGSHSIRFQPDMVIIMRFQRLHRIGVVIQGFILKFKGDLGITFRDLHRRAGIADHGQPAVPGRSNVKSITGRNGMGTQRRICIHNYDFFDRNRLIEPGGHGDPVLAFEQVHQHGRFPVLVGQRRDVCDPLSPFAQDIHFQPGIPVAVGVADANTVKSTLLSSQRCSEYLLLRHIKNVLHVFRHVKSSLICCHYFLTTGTATLAPVFVSAPKLRDGAISRACTYPYRSKS